jgi:hypothetical protein
MKFRVLKTHQLQFSTQVMPQISISGHNTLKFYGFDNIQMIEDPLLDKNPNLIFQAQYKQMIINLHSLDEDEYLNSNNVKYAYRHAYYDYQVVMEK